MRTVLKTSYDQDIDAGRDWRDRLPYLVLLGVLIIVPLGLDRFWLGEIEYVMILAIAGVGLMLLTGYTGLVSIGHAAFLGIGAYAHAVLIGVGVPFPVSLLAATLISAVIGLCLGLPTLRLSGIYLAIATVAFGFLTEQAFARWDWITGGHRGMSVPRPQLFGLELTAAPTFYYICLTLLVATLAVAYNLLRSPTGRAFVAIRDSEIAARSMGIDLTFYRGLSFAISAGMTGLAGGLMAHKIGYLAPEAFNLQISIKLLLIVVVGGLGSLHGAVFGAIVAGFLPQAIALMRDTLPFGLGTQPGLEPGLFGLILVLVVIYEPRGIYGRWLKIKLFFQMFPLYPRATFKRTKAFARSERNR